MPRPGTPRPRLPSDSPGRYHRPPLPTISLAPPRPSTPRSLPQSDSPRRYHRPSLPAISLAPPRPAARPPRGPLPQSDSPGRYHCPPLPAISLVPPRPAPESFHQTASPASRGHASTYNPRHITLPLAFSPSPPLSLFAEGPTANRAAPLPAALSSTYFSHLEKYSHAPPPNTEKLSCPRADSSLFRAKTGLSKDFDRLFRAFPGLFAGLFPPAPLE